jgi:hypothetical protein
MTSKAKAKGNAWEREICGFLKETLGGHFMRVPNSGAYIGGTNNFRKETLSAAQTRHMKGDIVPPDDLPLLNIEAKNYADIAFHQIIDGGCKQLDGWIDQTEEPADADDVSFTIFKITRKGSWVAFKSSLLSEFDMSGLSHVVYLKAYGTPEACPYIVTNHEKFFTQNAAMVRKLGAAKTSE